MIFVNRKEELELLDKWVKSKFNVLVLGLRGYGKTSLLKRFTSVKDCKKIGVYVDCLMIYSPSDLINALKEQLLNLEKKGCLKVNNNLFNSIMVELRDSRDALVSFYSAANEHDLDFIIFDEVSILFRRFGVLRPFRGLGGSRAVGELLKSLLDTYKEISTIFSDTSLDFQYELFENYNAPLFREYQAYLEIGPLSLNDSLFLIKKLSESRGFNISDEVALLIAEVSGGVPIYIEMLTAIITDLTDESVAERDIEYALEYGLLDKYFTALLEKFSWTEQEVLLAIAKGNTRFNELQREIPGCAQALESLKRKGIIVNVKKGKKESFYIIKDKLFAGWLATKEKPGYRKLSYKRARLLAMSFEALIRELFFTLKKKTRLKDFLGNEIEVEPPSRVIRHESGMGEIDLIAEYKNGEAIVGEVYFGYNCKKQKVDQLVKNIQIARKLGYKVKYGLLITYFPPMKDTLDYVRTLNEKGEKIYLLTEKELREIGKNSAISIP